ncbi:1282_t:CDS:2 [Acaulospora colombiana]|uniref:1282_t:CDS:1 n=1 Tax=Acaulospora colombiana TaxID=27376 RepID=A0ACA9LQQ3_9GLOM|nr:1282_t:CDS:2 [Acaulospora colombiana]
MDQEYDIECAEICDVCPNCSWCIRSARATKINGGDVLQEETGVVENLLIEPYVGEVVRCQVDQMLAILGSTPIQHDFTSTLQTTI